MLDDQIFKTVIKCTPLISIDLIFKKGNKILLGRRVNKPAQGYFFSIVVGFTKMSLLTRQW